MRMLWQTWRTVALVAGIALLTAASPPAPSDVRLEITSRAVAFNGASFGDRGQYERLSGIAHMAIDPVAPANRAIVHPTYAPAPADGRAHSDVAFPLLR